MLAINKVVGVFLKRSKLYIPTTVSHQARDYLSSIDVPVLTNEPFPKPDDYASWENIHAHYEVLANEANELALKTYKPNIDKKCIGGTQVLDIRPKNWARSDKILIYIHGGAYTLLSAASTLDVSVLTAHETGLRVISIDYTVAPKARHPEILNQCFRVVESLLDDGVQMHNIAVLGDSAGGALAAGMILKLRDDGLGLPAACVLVAPWSDITNVGDTSRTLEEAEPYYLYDLHLKPSAEAYADIDNYQQPYISPVYADYTKGFPPTLIQGGTKEIFLSHFVRHYQALDQAGVKVKLDLYEGMIHGFVYESPSIPESKIARGKIVQFLENIFSRP